MTVLEPSPTDGRRTEGGSYSSLMHILFHSVSYALFIEQMFKNSAKWVSE